MNKNFFSLNDPKKKIRWLKYRSNYKSLELDKAISWDLGALIYWDRIRIHSSGNFLKNGIISKTCIALFTSKK